MPKYTILLFRCVRALCASNAGVRSNIGIIFLSPSLPSGFIRPGFEERLTQAHWILPSMATFWGGLSQVILEHITKREVFHRRSAHPSFCPAFTSNLLFCVCFPLSRINIYIFIPIVLPYTSINDWCICGDTFAAWAKRREPLSPRPARPPVIDDCEWITITQNEWSVRAPLVYCFYIGRATLVLYGWAWRPTHSKLYKKKKLNYKL